jgi:hypothetical protein
MTSWPKRQLSLEGYIWLKVVKPSFLVIDFEEYPPATTSGRTFMKNDLPWMIFELK